MDRSERAQSPGPSAFTALRRFSRARPPLERCELCSAGLTADHLHLLDLSNRQLVCACQACAILFSGRDNARYRRVPRRLRFLPDFVLTDAQWDALLIPVGMAFLFRNAAEERLVACYPSPAGATESLLELEAWHEILRDNPVIAEMEPDVEALLVNRTRGRQEHYLVPIDDCYRLVGMIRLGWRGLSGGAAVWQDIQQFFDDLKERSTPVRQESHARP